MDLETRSPHAMVPAYSLTGDLLSYLRCNRQYRYQNGSSLPPARPVQLWFGEFIHGVMEAGFALWRAQNPKFPWPCTMVAWDKREQGMGLKGHDVGEIGRRVELVLGRQGKIPRSKFLRESAYARAEAAINQLGPALFPLVAAAEEPLSGSRVIPNTTGDLLRAERYELTGIVDVLTDVELTKCDPNNIFRKALESALGKLPPKFEVIVDYKGARRPPTKAKNGGPSGYWDQHFWQVETYGWLRRTRTTLPVVAGVLLYINELAPSGGDIAELKEEVRDGRTDVIPDAASVDRRNLSRWESGQDTLNLLSMEFRLRRAIRVIEINDKNINFALGEFDKTVLDIEHHIAKEAKIVDIGKVWLPTCSEEETCAACDFAPTCSKPAGQKKPGDPPPPHAP